MSENYNIKGDHLYLGHIDLAALAEYWMSRSGEDDSPLTIRYLPSISENLRTARAAFAQASQQTGYPGEIRIAYASKANPNEPVIRTALRAGADYECSSRVDTAIIRHAFKQGWLDNSRLIIANGFKTAGYAHALIELAREGHPTVTPVFDALCEIEHFVGCDVNLNVGLRYCVPGRSERFGMEDAEIFEAAKRISDLPNLNLSIFHAIQHYPALESEDYLNCLKQAIEVFNKLRALYPTLVWFDLGGGLPTHIPKTGELQEWMTLIQRLVMQHSDPQHIPGLIIESGRYLAGSHEIKIFRVDRTKQIGSTLYYILGGGIMSNLPDSWALGLEFPLVALNHCQEPCREVRLAGLTCDPDDVYPKQPGKTVSLPIETQNLLIGFMEIGAYQDIIGGEGGANHCLLTEGATVLIGNDPEHPDQITYRPNKTAEQILSHIGFNYQK